MSVEKTLKSQFLYKLPKENLLVISREPKWRQSYSRACLYNVCEHGNHFCMEFLWESYWQLVEDRNCGQILPVHAYISHVSVGKTLKSPFLHKLPMSKLLEISRRPKWRPRFSRTCLYSVCEREKGPKTAIFVWTTYEQVVGNQSSTKMAAEIFSCMPIECM